MEVTEESLHQRYSTLETEELVELQHTSDLTDIALSVLEKILTERSVSPSERDKVIELLEEKSTAEDPLSSISRLIDGQNGVFNILDLVQIRLDRSWMWQALSSTNSGQDRTLAPIDEKSDPVEQLLSTRRITGAPSAIHYLL